MKIPALVLGCVLAMSLAARAQEAPAPSDLNALQIQTQPLPSGALIDPAPESAHWTIVSSFVAPPTPSAPPSSGAPAAKPTPPTVSTVTKSGKNYLIETVGSDGSKMTRWKSDQFQATYPPGLSRPVLSYSPGLFYIDFSRSAFPDFSWISARNYVGVVKLGAGAGLVFKAKVATRDGRMPFLAQAHPSQSDAVAVVDAQTHHPLYLQLDSELLRYQVSDGGDQVDLPKEVKQAFDVLRRQIRQSSQVPPG